MGSVILGRDNVILGRGGTSFSRPGERGEPSAGTGLRSAPLFYVLVLAGPVHLWGVRCGSCRRGGGHVRGLAGRDDGLTPLASMVHIRAPSPTSDPKLDLDLRVQNYGSRWRGRSPRAAMIPRGTWRVETTLPAAFVHGVLCSSRGWKILCDSCVTVWIIIRSTQHT